MLDSPDADSKWALALTRSVLQGISTPYAKTDEQDCVRAHHIPHQPPTEYHTLILDERWKFFYSSQPNQGMMITLVNASNQINDAMAAWTFNGPIIVARQEGADIWAEHLFPDGPKLLNVDMEDWVNAIKYIASYKRMDMNPPVHETYLQGLASMRFCPDFLWSKHRPDCQDPATCDFLEHYRPTLKGKLQQLWEEKLEKEKSGQDADVSLSNVKTADVHPDSWRKAIVHVVKEYSQPQGQGGSA